MGFLNAKISKPKELLCRVIGEPGKLAHLETTKSFGILPDGELSLRTASVDSLFGIYTSAEHIQLFLCLQYQRMGLGRSHPDASGQ